eukprot:CAMPEP_0184859868 /NCGR_PEP_ID=MMETSP0580-20130426/4833_1 /TAXON_ID=1118495 /ORGANISM="Dactyliosolen fragilissimus" /LENGTH=1965 /DNA_ID=CAMNT_0027356725 /DNA_START=12 /DNA_END=5909 /DNA_ORIENTATION=+
MQQQPPSNSHHVHQQPPINFPEDESTAPNLQKPMYVPMQISNPFPFQMPLENGAAWPQQQFPAHGHALEAQAQKPLSNNNGKSYWNQDQISQQNHQTHHMQNKFPQRDHCKPMPAPTSHADPSNFERAATNPIPIHSHPGQNRQQFYEGFHTKKKMKESDGSTPRNDSSELSDAIENILESCESREDIRNNSSSIFDGNTDPPQSVPKDRKLTKECQGGNLTESEINHLSLLCTMYAQSETNKGKVHDMYNSEQVEQKRQSQHKESWASVDTDTLSSLMEKLEEHVSSASRVDLISDSWTVLSGKLEGNEVYSTVDQWMQFNSEDESNGYYRVCTIKRGLDAACVILSIMTSPGVSREVASDDAIDSAVSLMRHHLQKNVIPALSNTGHLNMDLSSSDTSTNDNKGVVGKPLTPMPRKKQRRSKSNTPIGNNQEVIRWMKKVYKHIYSTIGHLSLLIEKIQILINTIQIGDQPLLTLCPAAMNSLTIDPTTSTHGDTQSLTHIIHISCISLISNIFRQYSRHRDVILQDLIPLFLQLPTSKKSLRSFPVDGVIQISDMTSSRVSSTPNHSSIRKLSASISVNHLDDESHEKQHKVQMITALILYIVQGCATMPTQLTPEKTLKEKMIPSKFVSTGLEDCEKVSNMITSQLIHRCSKKGEDGGASEYRPLLFNLVEDLLLLTTNPNFPGADMLLLAICRRLSNDLLSNSSVGKLRNSTSTNVSAESTFLSTAMDAIGMICSDIAAKKKLYRNEPFAIPSEIQELDIDLESNPTTNSTEVNKCVCGRTSLVETFMLDCDRCHSWFHGSCMGIAKDKLPEMWICDACAIQLVIIEQSNFLSRRCGKKDTSKSAEDNKVDECNIMRLLLLNCLSNRVFETKSSHLRSARQFHLSNWIGQLEKQRTFRDCVDEKSITRSKTEKSCDKIGKLDINLMTTFFLENWCLDSYSLKSAPKSTRPLSTEYRKEQCSFLSNQGNSKVMLALHIFNSDLFINFSRLLGLIVALMGDDDNTSLRKLAVRAISNIVQVDSSIMGQPKVRDAVGQRFNDESISVREASVSLVGSYILLEPKLAGLFHNALLKKLIDSGVSVRKRVVKIFYELLSSNPNYAGRTAAYTVMLQSAVDPKEDDGVRDLIYEAFQNLWFSDDRKMIAISAEHTPPELLEPARCGERQGQTAVVTPVNKHKMDRSKKPQKLFPAGAYATAMQMVEIIRASKSSDILAVFVKDVLFGLVEGNKKSKAVERRRRQCLANKQCSNIITCLMEQLLSFEERRSTHSISSTHAGSQLNAIISTLGVFAAASPVLLLHDIETLLPYLKADNEVSRSDEGLITMNVCKILSHVSECFTSTHMLRIGQGDVSEDLKKITYNFGSATMSAAIEALSKLASKDDNESNLHVKLLSLAKSFYTYLAKMKDAYDDFSKSEVRIKNNVHRALSAVGLICRYHDRKIGHINSGCDAIELVFVEPPKLSINNLPFASYVLFEEYLSKSDIPTKCKALRAMSGIFMSHPRIMLTVEEDGIFTELMSNETQLDLQLEALSCWREILASEEKRIESGEAKRKMELKDNITLSQKISGDQDGDASLIASCVTQHIERLFEMTSHKHPKIRFNSLLLIEVLLRQGLINPMETVPFLLALQGDIRNTEIRIFALKLLIREGEKRPDMLRQRVCAGIYRAYEFQRAVYPNISHVTALIGKSSECIFGQIFKDAVRSSRSQSIRILRSLLGLFGKSGENRIDGSASHRIARNESLLDHIPLLSFAAEVIAHLPYNHLGDILFIIYHISNTVAMEGNAHVEKFALFLQSYNLSNTDKYDADIAQEDKLEKASKEDYPSRVKELEIILSNSFDTEKFAELCAEASSFVLLLRLKDFFRKTYNGVTAIRLRDYMPNEKERITDRGLSQPSDMSTFDSDIESLKNDMSLDLDSLIRLYSNFRQVMRANEAFTEDLEDYEDDLKADHTNRKRENTSVEEESDY